MPKSQQALPFPPPSGRSLVLVAVLIVTGLVVARLADVILMAFGAVLVAVLLQALAEPLQRFGWLSRTVALGLAVLVVVASTSLALWVFGREAEAQFASLSELLPDAWTEFQALLGRSPVGEILLRDLRALDGGGWLLELGPRLAAQAAGALAGTVIVLFAGLYLAFHPRSYTEGALLLLPRQARPRAREVLSETFIALKRWLLGQLFSMVLVGMTTGVGLALVGVPSAAALAVISGLGQFVPVVGPMAAVVPGLLVSLAEGPETFLWALAVYLGAAQLEANVITPLILRRLAQLPMAVTLFAVLAMGVLLGPLGVLFATPLALVAYVLVKMIYVEGILGEPPAQLIAEEARRFAE